MLSDAPHGGGALTSVVRSIVRANPRIGALDALAFAVVTRNAAHHEGVNEQFIAATLLEESGFDPNAISGAGAYGIAQFSEPTARFYGIDPFDPRAAIAGATHVLAAYLTRYSHVDGDPYAFALAAYNAGPGAVRYYNGVPPYLETRRYIADINERWARLLDER